MCTRYIHTRGVWIPRSWVRWACGFWPKNPQQCPQCIMLHLNDTPELIADLLQCRSTVTKMMIIDSDRWSECKLEKNDSEIWIIICKGNFNWQGRVRVRIKVKDIGSGLSFWLVSRLLDQLAKILQFQLRKLGIIRLACQMVANWRYQFFACYCQITDLMLTQNLKNSADLHPQADDSTVRWSLIHLRNARLLLRLSIS